MEYGPDADFARRTATAFSEDSAGLTDSTASRRGVKSTTAKISWCLAKSSKA